MKFYFKKVKKKKKNTSTKWNLLCTLYQDVYKCRYIYWNIQKHADVLSPDITCRGYWMCVAVLTSAQTIESKHVKLVGHIRNLGLS